MASVTGVYRVERIHDRRPGRQHGVGRQAAARPACGAWQQHRSELIDITRQLCGAGDQLILRHEIREQVGVLLGAERARRSRRHRLDLGEHHVRGPAEPGRPELDTFERRAKFAVVQILAVARRAALFVDGVPGALLRRRERRRAERLRGDWADQARRQNRGRDRAGDGQQTDEVNSHRRKDDQ